MSWDVVQYIATDPWVHENKWVDRFFGFDITDAESPLIINMINAQTWARNSSSGH